MSENCSLSDTRDILQSKNDEKAHLEKGTHEGAAVTEIDLGSKEKDLKIDGYDEIKIDPQFIDGSCESHAIKQNLVIEPNQDFLQLEPSRPTDVSLAVTENQSMIFKEVQTGTKEQNILQPDTSKDSIEEENILETDVEVMIPIAVADKEDEVTHPLRINILKKEKPIPTRTPREVISSQVS